MEFEEKASDAFQKEYEKVSLEINDAILASGLENTNIVKGNFAAAMLNTGSSAKEVIDLVKEKINE